MKDVKYLIYPIVAAFIAVVAGMFAYNIGMSSYHQYKHESAVRECKKEASAPSWANGAVGWACENWAK